MNNKKIKPPRNTLGKGLSALLQDSVYVPKQDATNPLQEIPISQIELNPRQPRKYFNPATLQELSESIKVHGIIQPLTVKYLRPNKYQLIAGERRLQVAKQVGLQQVPAYIRKANDQQMLEMALVENIQRENLNPIEIALSYQRLLTECRIRQETLGRRVGKNRTTVNNYLRLLKLPPDIQLALRDQAISMGHARALINIKAPAIQLRIFKAIIQQGLSVRKVESLAKNLIDKEDANKVSPKKKSFIEDVQYLTKKLSIHLDTSVKIHVYREGEGEIRIIFTDAQDLLRITQRLGV